MVKRKIYHGSTRDKNPRPKSSSEVLIQIRKNQFADKKLERASEKRQKIRKINHDSAKKLEPNKNY